VLAHRDAEEFGGDIPVGPFALIGSDAIGRGIVETLAGHPSPAVLMRQHGPFTIGATAKTPFKAGVMCEDVARTCHFARAARRRGPAPEAGRRVPHDRYRNVYGQQATGSTDTGSTTTGRKAHDDARGLVPHRQPGLYGPGDPGAGAVQSRQIAAGWTSRRTSGAGRVAAGADLGRRHRAGVPGGQRRTRWSSGSSRGCHNVLAGEMWIAGLDALRTPLLHLHTQANVTAAVGRHRTWTS